MRYLTLFLSTVFINNFLLHYFLGNCPFLGCSAHLSSALGMGLAVIFVMGITAAVCWPIYWKILVPFNLTYLQIVVFILVIAALVQLVEMFLRKYSRPLYRALGIYLPLITTNCAVLGLALIMVLKRFNYPESVVFGLGGGAG
ncbi:MAG TPA: Rnf-Nqr domain containing protein, partial [bacterium]|nr:Rnf-Nqr domain containing protein [bacterium]